MKSLIDESVVESLKKHKKKGIIVVALCVLACKIPLLIALFGLGGLSWAALTIPAGIVCIECTQRCGHENR